MFTFLENFTFALVLVYNYACLHFCKNSQPHFCTFTSMADLWWSGWPGWGGWGQFTVPEMAHRTWNPSEVVFQSTSCRLRALWKKYKTFSNKLVVLQFPEYSFNVGRGEVLRWVSCCNIWGINFHEYSSCVKVRHSLTAISNNFQQFDIFTLNADACGSVEQSMPL